MSPIIKSYVESFEESNGKAMRWLISNKKNSSHFTLDVMDCNSNKILVFDVVNKFSFYLPKRIFLIKLRIWSRVNKKIKANFVDSSINSDKFWKETTFIQLYREISWYLLFQIAFEVWEIKLNAVFLTNSVSIWYWYSKICNAK